MAVAGLLAVLNVLLIVSCNITISLGSHRRSAWKTGARGAQGSAAARQVTDDGRRVFFSSG